MTILKSLFESKESKAVRLAKEHDENRNSARNALQRFMLQSSIMSSNLDTSDLRTLARVNNGASDLEALVLTMNKYIRACPDDAPMGFVALFLECYLQLVRNARQPSGDPIADLKANAKGALVALHLIVKYPDCAEEGFKLLSGLNSIPGHLTLRLDLAAPTPQERAWAVTAIYDRFWQHFIAREVESPVSAGGRMSLKAYLTTSGLGAA